MDGGDIDPQTSSIFSHFSLKKQHGKSNTKLIWIKEPPTRKLLRTILRSYLHKKIHEKLFLISYNWLAMVKHAQCLKSQSQKL